MRRAPGAERFGALVSRIDEDEDGALDVQHDRQLDRGVAPGVPGGAPVHPEGQDPVLAAERLQPPEPGQLGRLHPVRLLDGLIGEHLAHGGVDPALRPGGGKGSCDACRALFVSWPVLGLGTRTSEVNQVRRRRPARVVIGGSRFRAVRVSIPATLRSPFRAVSSTGREGIFQEVQPRPTA